MISYEAAQSHSVPLTTDSAEMPSNLSTPPHYQLHVTACSTNIRRINYSRRHPQFDYEAGILFVINNYLFLARGLSLLVLGAGLIFVLVLH